MKHLVSFLALAMFVCVFPASAAVIFYVGNPSSNSTDWTSAVTGLGAAVNTNVDFESHALGGLIPTHYLGSNGVTLTASSGSDIVTSGTGPNDGNTDASNAGEGSHPASNYLRMPSPGGGTSFLIVSFADPVLGAGLFTIDRFFAGGSTNDIALEAYDGAGATGTLLGSTAGLSLNFQPDNLYFMGVVSTAGDIRSIRLVRGPDNTGDTMGVDDILFTSGTSEIPEPATIVLLGAGLAAIGAFRHLFRA